jgi:hypothetical protein
MGRMNAEYGSELHLLRMLGRHRAYLDKQICEHIGAQRVDWLDFPSRMKRTDSRTLWDREWQNLEFLSADNSARVQWNLAWPSHRTGPNWDAVGRLHFANSSELLLVEAKANQQEIRSSCKAEDPKSLKLIRDTLNLTKQALGAPESSDWLTPYYQLCNRLAVLHTMNTAGEPAHLLYIYFYGDVSDASRDCPPAASDWDSALDNQNEHIGLSNEHPLKDRVHKLFLDVQCQ